MAHAQCISNDIMAHAHCIPNDSMAHAHCIPNDIMAHAHCISNDTDPHAIIFAPPHTTVTPTFLTVTSHVQYMACRVYCALRKYFNIVY